jgi:hypothetical protein
MSPRHISYIKESVSAEYYNRFLKQMFVQFPFLHRILRPKSTLVSQTIDTSTYSPSKTTLVDEKPNTFTYPPSKTTLVEKTSQ